MLKKTDRYPLSNSQAEEMAIRALNFLAGDKDHMSRFMKLSGLEPGDIAGSIRLPSFQIALLDHLMSDETLLLTFCANENIDPQLVAPALHLLAQSGAE